MTTAPPDRYPLAWPAGWPRTPAGARRVAAFGKVAQQRGSAPDAPLFRRAQALSVADAVQRLSEELRRLGASSDTAVISSNLALRLDGLPRSDQREPADPGAALYFRLKGQPRVLACDRWTRVADNIAALAAHINAIRAVDRYGVGSLAQAFAGYRALPEQASPWWTVLEFASRPHSLQQVEERFNQLARKHHPDAGGDPLTFGKLSEARVAARLDLEPVA